MKTVAAGGTQSIMKIAVSFLLFAYAGQLSFASALILMLNDNDSLAGKIILGLAALFILAAFAIGFVFSVLSIVQPGRATLSYKRIMWLKVAMIPFFLINFALCFCLVAGFLNPFLMVGLIVLIPLLVSITYCFILPFSIASAVKTIRLLKEQKAGRGELIVWQILEFFFVIDVIASIVLFARFEKKKQLQ